MSLKTGYRVSSGRLSVFRQLWIFSEPAVPAQTHHAKERLAEDAAAHFARALATVDEHHRHLLDLEANLVGGVFHLNLEGIALEADLIEVDGLQHTATVADEARGGVVDADARDKAHILRGEVAHQYAAHGPVDHVDALNVTGPHGHVAALVVAGGIKARQVVGVVAEVGVHLEDVLIIALERPFEASDIGCAQSLFATALNQEEAVGKLVALQPFHDVGRTVGTAVVNYKNMEAFLQAKDGADNLLHVLLLVIRGDNNYRITRMHSRMYYFMQS